MAVLKMTGAKMAAGRPVGGRVRPVMLGALALLAAGCALPEGSGPGPGGRFGIALQDRERPEILQREGLAVRGAAEDVPGYWGVLPGLEQAERAIVENLASGASVQVSLWSGDTGREGAVIRLSPQAADELGILATPARVRVTALRREPLLVAE